jgi:hypothetical protein
MSAAILGGLEKGVPMKTSIAVIICIAVATPLIAQSATDNAEQRLGKLLAPGSRSTVAQPIKWKAGKAVEGFDVPIKPYAGLPVPLSAPPRKEVKPGSPPEGISLNSHQGHTPAPQPVELPTQPLIRLPSLDLHTALAIPILAQAAKDRASLAEPAFDASLAAAMKRFTPVRDKPVPFTPLNLPDPFEHVRYGELRHPPSEDPMPPVLPLTKPK